jgi:PKD repeat protein
VAPLAVFFDATGTTSTGTTRPFHELGYQWNFGDALATWDTTGSSKNLATGGVAAHVFEQPGTYTVTLTVTDGVNSQTTTSTITVQDPNTVFSGANTTLCYRNGASGRGCWRLSRRCGRVQSSTWPTIVNNYAQTEKRVLLKRGDVFTVRPATAWLTSRRSGHHRRIRHWCEARDPHDGQPVMCS